MSIEIGERKNPEREGVIFVIYHNRKILIEDRRTPEKTYFGYKIIPGGKKRI